MGCLFGAQATALTEHTSPFTQPREWPAQFLHTVDSHSGPQVLLVGRQLWLRPGRVAARSDPWGPPRVLLTALGLLGCPRGAALAPFPGSAAGSRACTSPAPRLCATDPFLSRLGVHWGAARHGPVHVWERSWPRCPGEAGAVPGLCGGPHMTVQNLDRPVSRGTCSWFLSRTRMASLPYCEYHRLRLRLR